VDSAERLGYYAMLLCFLLPAIMLWVGYHYAALGCLEFSYYLTLLHNSYPNLYLKISTLLQYILAKVLK